MLLHCYSCSLHWWDQLAPILAENHRVIRIDLLGHGGSQKPSSGYSIEDQGGLVAGALDQLDVQGAVVVGHSMGFAVAVALAERASQLVDRLVNIDQGPTTTLLASRSSPSSATCRCSGEAHLASEPGLRGQGRLRRRVRARATTSPTASRTPIRSSTTTTR